MAEVGRLGKFGRPVKEIIPPPIPEIIWAKDVRATVVCGFLMK